MIFTGRESRNRTHISKFEASNSSRWTISLYFYKILPWSIAKRQGTGLWIRHRRFESFYSNKHHLWACNSMVECSFDRRKAGSSSLPSPTRFLHILNYLNQSKSRFFLSQWYFSPQNACKFTTLLSVKPMPQVDKATFLPIVFWTFVLYTGGYLLLNLSFLFRFFSSMKLTTKRAVAVQTSAVLTQKMTNNIMFFPWISL